MIFVHYRKLFIFIPNKLYIFIIYTNERKQKTKLYSIVIVDIIITHNSFCFVNKLSTLPSAMHCHFKISTAVQGNSGFELRIKNVNKKHVKVLILQTHLLLHSRIDDNSDYQYSANCKSVGSEGELQHSGTALAWHAGSAGFESPRGQHFVQPQSFGRDYKPRS